MAHLYIPPPIETATDPIHSVADMGQRWRAVIGPLGFSERLLWIGFVGPDRRMVKALSQVPLGPRPRRPFVKTTMTALLDVLDGLKDDASVALLLTRPGKGPILDADRQWSTLLTEVAADLGTCPLVTYDGRLTDAAIAARIAVPPPPREGSDTQASRAPGSRRGCRRPSSAPADPRDLPPIPARYRPEPRRCRGCCA